MAAARSSKSEPPFIFDEMEIFALSCRRAKMTFRPIRKIEVHPGSMPTIRSCRRAGVAICDVQADTNAFAALPKHSA